MTTRPYHVWIDQHNEVIWARTVEELRQRAGGGRVSKMYTDKKDGSTVQTGYIIGQRWFTKFAPVELPA